MHIRSAAKRPAQLHGVAQRPPDYRVAAIDPTTETR